MNITCYTENIIINNFLLINIYKNFTKNIRVNFINENTFFYTFLFHKMIKMIKNTLNSMHTYHYNT